MYNVFFGISIFIALSFPLYSAWGVKLVLEGRLGQDPNDPKRKAHFFSPMGIYTKGLIVLGNAIFLPVLKTLLRAFTCVYPDGVQARHIVLGEMRCWEGAHLAYIYIAVLAIALYYPLASYVYPNLQFADKSVDLKFDPMFMIFQQQTRLAIAGVVVVGHAHLTMVMCFTGCVHLWQMVVNIRTEPCVVLSVNHWRTFEFAVQAWCCACAALLLVSGMRQVAWAVLIGGLVLIVTGTLFSIYRARSLTEQGEQLSSRDSLAEGREWDGVTSLDEDIGSSDEDEIPMSVCSHSMSQSVASHFTHAPSRSLAGQINSRKRVPSQKLGAVLAQDRDQNADGEC